MARDVLANLRIRFVALYVVALLSMVYVLLALANSVSAADDPLNVWGKVTDSMGTPISGASVTVTVIRTGAIRSDSSGTDINGNYQIDSNFNAGDYNVGDTLRVTTVCGLGPKDTDKQIEQELYQIVDVQYGTAIPEFGSTIGLLVAAFMAGLVALVVVGKKRT